MPSGGEPPACPCNSRACVPWPWACPPIHPSARTSVSAPPQPVACHSARPLAAPVPCPFILSVTAVCENARPTHLAPTLNTFLSRPWATRLLLTPGPGAGLTGWPLHPEMHRTQTRFEDAFTLKVFVFQFVNFYSSPVYIAFFKGRSAPPPPPCAPGAPRGRPSETLREGGGGGPGGLGGQRWSWARASEHSWAPGPPRGSCRPGVGSSEAQSRQGDSQAAPAHSRPRDLPFFKVRGVPRQLPHLVWGPQ